MISPTQRPLSDNTEHSQQTDIHASGGIRIPNPSKRAAADPRLRPPATGIGMPIDYCRKFCSPVHVFKVPTLEVPQVKESALSGSLPAHGCCCRVLKTVTLRPSNTCCNVWNSGGRITSYYRGTSKELARVRRCSNLSVASIYFVSRWHHHETTIRRTAIFFCLWHCYYTITATQTLLTKLSNKCRKCLVLQVRSR
jgi:hypothetical protein